MTPRMKLGAELRRLRRDAGLTQWQVAEPLGFSTAQFVSNWERGVSTPPRAQLGQLARILGVKLVDLVDLVFAADAEELRLEKAAVLKDLKMGGG